MNVIFLVEISRAVSHTLLLNLACQIVGNQRARINVVFFVAYYSYTAIPIYFADRLDGPNRRSAIANYYVLAFRLRSDAH
jgi:hypothetical protein